jgi:hypothetical protein
MAQILVVCESVDPIRTTAKKSRYVQKLLIEFFERVIGNMVMIYSNAFEPYSREIWFKFLHCYLL